MSHPHPHSAPSSPRSAGQDTGAAKGPPVSVSSKNSDRPLRNITRELLEPVWSKRSITTEEIGRRLDVSGSAIRLKAKTLGLLPRGSNQPQKCDDETFRKLWMAGVSTTDIAERFRYADRACVSKRRVLLGLPQRQRGPAKGRSGWAGTIQLAEFSEAEIGRRMRAAQ